MDATIITIAVVLAVIILGFVVVPQLKMKGYIKESNVQITDHLLKISKIIASKIDMPDGKKNAVLTVFSVAETVVKYIEQTSKDADNHTKKTLAVQTVIELLADMKIDVPDDLHKLIELGIESAVNALPKTNKKA